jgi:hypothetical protein
MVDLGAAAVFVFTEVEIGCSSCFVEDGIEEVGAEIVSGFVEVENPEAEVAIPSLLAELLELVLVAA